MVQPAASQRLPAALLGHSPRDERGAVKGQ